jgi:hypothetical protein
VSWQATGYVADWQQNRYGGNDGSVLLTPRRPNTARRAVIYAHGANGDGRQVLDAVNYPSVVKQNAQIALAGFVVLSGDFGGLDTFGNDACLTALENAWTWLKASGLCATDKVILSGASMGMLSISRFAADHESETAGMNGWIPALDIEYLRTNDTLGLRDTINTAWGLAPGSTESTVAVPARGNAMSRAGEVTSIPTHLWYSSADVVMPESSYDTYTAAQSSAVLHEVSTTEPHSDTLIGMADIAAIISFYESIA